MTFTRRRAQRPIGALALFFAFVVALFSATTAGAASAMPTSGATAGILSDSLTLALPGTPDGVSAWGGNTVGELGNGTTTGSAVPVAVSGLSGVTAIAGGGSHGLALMSNGTVMAWGAGTDGQLGDERKVNSDIPVQVPGLSGVTAIAAGGDFSLALLSNGTVMAWGENFYGELGNGTKTRSYVPVAVSGLSGVTAIAAGQNQSLALLSNGTVMDWGENAAGQLGNGTATSSDVPVPVSGLSGVTAIASGKYRSLARLSNGTVMAWGEGLGNGTTNSSDVPVQVSGLTTATAVAAGFEHSLALLSNGTVMAWGGNGYGQLGNGTTTSSDVPVQVSGLSTVTAIAAGYWHSLAVLSNGMVMDWGNNAHGQLGNGATANSDVPVEVSGLRGATAVAGGYSDSLALNPVLATVTGIEPTGGPTTGGTAVTIKGTGFANATGVKFGASQAASFTVNSETSITAVSPPGTGTVDTIVSTPGGTSAPGSGDKFTYGLSVSRVLPGAGPPGGGTSVTITGAGFSGTTAVMFGSSSASFTVRSENTIEAVSPPGTGVVNVTVTTPQGTSATSSADQFSYAPLVTGISPKGGEESGGTSVTITGANFAGATAVKFGASNAQSFKVESENTIKAVSPPGAGDVEVSVTTAGGTSPASGSEIPEYDRFRYFGPSTCTPHETERPVVTSVQPTSGPGSGGNSVTIKGENFYKSTACTETLIRVYPVVNVMFGNKEAINYNLETFGKEGPGEVVAIAPPGSGTVDVTVETFTTSLTKASDQYSYTSSAPPTVASVQANHGPPAGGTSVTITGANLTGATAVKFGSRNATSFTVNSETSITAIAPPWGSGDGVAEVTVTTPAGTSALSLGDSFVYEPTVTTVEPGSGRATGGTTVTISGAAFEGVYTNGSGERPAFVKSVKFGSTNATSFKLEPTGQISAVAPPGSGTVDVTVTTEGGTSPTSTADHFTYEPIRAEFKNWLFSGGMMLKKINQPITLPAGGTFNGSAALNPQTLSGPLTGSVAIPSFNAIVKILGVPATIGLEFSEVGSVEGSVELSRTTPGDLSLSVPTKENVSFTTIGILGIKIATKCHSTEPLSLPLLAELSASRLLTTGAHFMGTTPIAPVSCEGKNATLESSVLTSLFSGPSNPYSMAIAPPA